MANWSNIAEKQVIKKLTAGVTRESMPTNQTGKCFMNSYFNIMVN